MIEALKPAVFLDRDGTLNVEKNYLHRIEDWEWIPGAVEAIKLINQMGFLAVVVTNQAGIARGYYQADDVRLLHQQVDELLALQSARIDAYYFCPHHPQFGEKQLCDCRKPEPGMLLAASRDLGIDLTKSFVIGDKVTDIETAKNLGIPYFLVLTGYGKKYKMVCAQDCITTDVLTAVKIIKKLNEQIY